MKKLLAILLCLIMVLGMLAGCTNKPDPTNPNETKAPNATGGEDPTDGTEPPEDITLTIGIRDNANVIDYDTNAFTLWLEEQTGYNIEFEKFPAKASEAATRLSTAAAIGEKLPDILFRFDLGAAVVKEYGEQGYFANLRDYFYDGDEPDTTGPAQIFWERLQLMSDAEQIANLRRMTDQTTGAIYSVPRIEQSMVDPMNFQPWINREWMDELGLEDPTDPESLYEVLKAFKARDESCIPLLGIMDLGGKFENWIINMFIYNNEQRWASVDENGKLFFPAMTDEYRQALIYMNKLVKEGLLYDGSLVHTPTEMKSLVTPANGKARVGIWVGHPTLHISENNEVLYQYDALDCFGYAVMNENLNSRGTYITEGCEHKDAAFKLLMLMCSEEGSYRMRYGEKGVNWTEADPGTKSFLGLDAQIKILDDPWSKPGNAIWGTIDSTILINAEGEVSQVNNGSEWSTYKGDILAKQVENFTRAYNKNNITYCPTLVFSEEEEERVEQPRSDCVSIITKTRADFIKGTKDPNKDSDWNAYLRQLEAQGVQIWLEVAQAVYDRYLAE